MSDTRESAVAPFFVVIAIWLAVAGISLLFASAIVDGTGRKTNNHFESKPSELITIDKTRYIVRDRQYSPEYLCGSSEDTHGGVTETKVISSLDGALYVACTKEITWNDHREVSGDYADAMGRVLRSEYYQIPLGALLALGMLLPAGIARGNMVAKRVEKKKIKADAEDMRRELRTSFAKGEIDQQEFEDGLDRIYGLAKKKLEA
jgi:hypothetical protein